MKIVAVREAKASLSEYIAKAQRDRVLITRHGKPAALVIGVEGEDLEDLLTMANPRFWEMIEDRRLKNVSATLAEVRARYGVPRPPRRRQRRAKVRRRA
jgi:prevent-host-death family protein